MNIFEINNGKVTKEQNKFSMIEITNQRLQYKFTFNNVSIMPSKNIRVHH